MLSTYLSGARNIRNISALTGIALVVCAVFGAAWALPPERLTLAGLALGLSAALSFRNRRTVVTKFRLAPFLLACLAATAPYTLAGLDLAGAAITTATGQPLLGMTAVAGISAATIGFLARRTPTGLLPHSAAVFAAMAGGLLLGVTRLLPSLSPLLLGLVGLGLLCPMLWTPPPGAGLPGTSTSPSSDDGGIRGLLIGAGVPLLLLTAGPIFAPTPGWYAQAIAGLLLGFALAAAARGRAATFTQHVGPALLPLLLLGGSELLLRSPEFFLQLQGLLGSLASNGYLLSSTATVLVFALLGLCAGPSGRRSAPICTLGLLGWLALPPLLGGDTALRLTVGAAALLGLPQILAATRPRIRWAGGTAALAALLALALPLGPAGARLVSPYESFADPSRLAQLVRTIAHREASVDSSAAGTTISLLNAQQPLLWYRGTSTSLGPQQLAADHLLGHLPGLIGEPPKTVLVIGAGSGAVLDAVRRSTRGVVFVHEPLPGLRRLIRSQGEWNRQAAADPAIRFLHSAPLSPVAQRSYDAILVDLPPPWWPGGPSAYGKTRLDRVAEQLTPHGTAVFRVPLDSTSGDELATFVLAVCHRFPAVSAWLNPSGARNLLLVAQPHEGAIDAGAAYRAWDRATVREDLTAATMARPEDVLERLIANRHALIKITSGRSRRSWIGTAVVAGSRVRHGRKGLPLAALAEASSHEDLLFDLGTVPQDELVTLKKRLARSGEVRQVYLQMLGHWAAGEAGEALGLASQLARQSTSPARDLKAVIEPWLRRGDALRAQGLLQQARAEFLMAASFSPRDIEANLKLADACRMLDEQAEAERHYKIVIGEDSQHLRAALGLADLRQRQGRTGDAVELLEEVENSHPGSYELLVNLAFGQMQLARGTDGNVSKRLSRARTLFQRAAALEPGRPEGRAGLGEVYYRLGQNQRALTELDRALLLKDSCHYHSWRGHALQGLGRSEEAEREVQQALLACPELIDALVLLGNITANRGRYERAREAWQQVLALDPDNLAATFNLEQLSHSGVEQLQQGGAQ
jgi:tetratricopeptide (TPR) repeat protein